MTFWDLFSTGPAEKKELTEQEFLNIVYGDVGDYTIWSNWTEGHALRDGLEESVWAYAAITIVCNALASVEWFVEERENVNGIKRWVRVEEHPLDSLMEWPNNYMSRVDFMYRATQSLMLVGNFYAYIERRRGAIQALHPINADQIEEVPADNRLTTGHVIDHYQSVSVQQMRDKIRWETDEILHVMLQNPDEIYKGFGPFRAAHRTVEADSAAVNWNTNSLNRRAVPDGIFTFASTLTDDQFREATEQVQREYGGSRAGRRPMVLGAGADFKQLSITPVEMDFNASRKINLTEIAAAHGVLPALFSPDAATFSNLKEARRALWIDTVIPLLRVFQASLNRQLIPARDRGKYRLNFDLTNVEALKDNLDMRIKAWAVMINNGVPLNIASERMELGLPEIEGGDEPHGLRPIASQVIETRPTGSSPRPPEQVRPNRENPEPAGSDSEEEEMKKSIQIAVPILAKALNLNEDERDALIAATGRLVNGEDKA